MMQLFLEAAGEEFSVEFKETQGLCAGVAYSIQRWTKAGSEESGWSYVSRSSSCEMHDSLNDDCRALFEFSFCWRGVWEGRIDFKDDEYWSEEIKIMYLLWDKLEAILKARIRQQKAPAILED